MVNQQKDVHWIIGGLAREMTVDTYGYGRNLAWREGIVVSVITPKFCTFQHEAVVTHHRIRATGRMLFINPWTKLLTPDGGARPARCKHKGEKHGNMRKIWEGIDVGGREQECAKWLIFHGVRII